jgi:hypothetical protein
MNAVTDQQSVTPEEASQPGTGEEHTGPGSAAKAYRDKSGRDMARSLLVLLIPILIVGALLRACGSSDPTVVDTNPAIADARAAAVFPVVQPQGLGDGWQPVQATFRRADPAGAQGASLRLGYLTPSGGELLLVESNEDPARLLTRELGDEVQPQGDVVTRGDLMWTHSIVRGGERALVNIDEDRTIIIVGRVSLDELTTFAASLS